LKVFFDNTIISKASFLFCSSEKGSTFELEKSLWRRPRDIWMDELNATERYYFFGVISPSTRCCNPYEKHKYFACVLDPSIIVA
jgi:hypothetical protein